MGRKTLVELHDINKSFFTEEIETRALSAISLRIDEGEYLCLSGPSGCGKSTLLSLIGLLDTATSGSYSLNGVSVGELSRAQRAAIRNQQIGFVFQSFNLISDLTVEENVMLPLTYQGKLKTAQMRQLAREMLEKVDMANRVKHYPAQLSGGQQQRVAIARSLINKPAIILADEPTGNLDSKNAAAVMELFKQLNVEGCTICMVTHDPRSAQHASRQIEMMDGSIVVDDASPMAPIAIAEGAAACL